MSTPFSRLLALAAMTSVAAAVSAQQPEKPKPEDTEVWTPVPPVVTPGATEAAPPSDAIILFDGSNEDEWVSAQDHTPAQWVVHDGILTVSKAHGVGNIETKRKFKDYQLHVEWRIPENITGSGQGRGNSGVFLASTGPGDDGYELQVLDSYNNPTYVNGQGGSIYKQSPPLVNPGAQARRVADLRHCLDRPALQRGRLAEVTGLCDGFLQRRAGAESLRIERADPVHRQAVL
jgi:hypothetical protein